MNGLHLDYFDALKRLVDDRPIRVEKGARISNKSVAEEAGRSPGSIKKSRKSFAPLIAAIADARSQQVAKKNIPEQQRLRERASKIHYRDLFHQAVNREIMLYEQLAILEKRLKRFENVRSLFDS